MDAVNINGTRYIIDALLHLPQDKIRCLIYTSSIDVVATSSGILNANEDTPTILHNPSNGYKRTKSYAENLILSIHSQTLRCCSLRPGHIFGPGDSICEHSANAPAIGPTTARMAFTYVENTASAHLLAAYRLIEEKDLVISHLSSTPLTTALSSVNPSSLSPLSCNYSHLSYLTQTPLFIYDYNVNFCDTYHSFASRAPSPSHSRVSTALLRVVVTLVEFVERILVNLFGRHFLQSHPFLSLTSSVLEACQPLTIQSTRAFDLLFSSSSRGAGLHERVDQEEAIRRTRVWLMTGQMPLGGSGKEE
jgi:hypothetical protein